MIAIMSERRTSPTVYGIENEYTCMITLPGDVVHEIVGRCHSVDAALGLYQEPTAKGSDGIPLIWLAEALRTMDLSITETGMLSNGGRLYIDPSGPEYATPETTTAEEAVHRSFDGDEILLGVFQELQKFGVIEGYQFNRRVVDHNRSSRGIHLNTTTSLKGEALHPKIERWIATLNVAKGAIFGSGGLLVDKDGETAYHHSPRLSISSDVSRQYSEYKHRPLVRYPFKGDGNLSRVETVTSDALNFGWPLRASLVATNALIGLIEMGYGPKLPKLRHPLQAAHAVGQFGNNALITAINGNGEDIQVRPLDVLRQICEAVLEVDHTEMHLDKESDQVIPEIIDVSDKVSADMFAAAGQVESVARLVAMQKRMDSKKLSLDSEKMCRFDFAWDWLGGGIAETLRHKNKAGWQGFSIAHSPGATKRRLSVPPQDTRAKIRGEEIGLTEGDNHSQWHMLDSGQGSFYIHPLATSKA